jgi:hypothetical protein
MNDTELLSRKLRVLMNNEDIRKTFGDNAQKSVDHLKAANVTKLWKDIIEKSLNKTNV